MMMDEGFADVTLVTEDKKQIKANINILCACSPVFKNILKKDETSNQISQEVFSSLNWNQSYNLFILEKLHFIRKEWMNFFLWPNHWKSKNSVMLVLCKMMN